MCGSSAAFAGAVADARRRARASGRARGAGRAPVVVERVAGEQRAERERVAVRLVARPAGAQQPRGLVGGERRDRVRVDHARRLDRVAERVERARGELRDGLGGGERRVEDDDRGAHARRGLVDAAPRAGGRGSSRRPTAWSGTAIARRAAAVARGAPAPSPRRPRARRPARRAGRRSPSPSRSRRELVDVPGRRRCAPRRRARDHVRRGRPAPAPSSAACSPGPPSVSTASASAPRPKTIVRSPSTQRKLTHARGPRTRSRRSSGRRGRARASSASAAGTCRTSPRARRCSSSRATSRPCPAAGRAGARTGAA